MGNNILTDSGAVRNLTTECGKYLGVNRVAVVRLALTKYAREILGNERTDQLLNQEKPLK